MMSVVSLRLSGEGGGNVQRIANEIAFDETALTSTHAHALANTYDSVVACLYNFCMGFALAFQSRDAVHLERCRLLRYAACSCVLPVLSVSTPIDRYNARYDRRLLQGREAKASHTPFLPVKIR